MKLKINKVAEHKFYPDIENNLELEESKRFTFVMKKLHKFAIMEAVSLGEDKSLNMDKVEYIKSSILRIDNPITLEIEGKERPIEISDLFDKELDGLGDLAIMVWNEAVQINTKAVDEKKS
jgi:hypothetical protein